MTKSVMGIPSGDYECFCFDVPEAKFIKFEGESPGKYNSSFFHEGL